MSCPTVKVKCDNEQGFYIVNESDFDEENHELFSDAKEEKKGSVSWYKKKLDEMNIEYSDSDKKPELKSLYDSNIED